MVFWLQKLFTLDSAQLNVPWMSMEAIGGCYGSSAAASGSASSFGQAQGVATPSSSAFAAAINGLPTAAAFNAAAAAAAAAATYSPHGLTPAAAAAAAAASGSVPSLSDCSPPHQAASYANYSLGECVVPSADEASNHFEQIFASHSD